VTGSRPPTAYGASAFASCGCARLLAEGHRWCGGLM
jgi:hypothetical protein